MTDARENMEELLSRVAAGRLDDLTPEQIDALEVYLNDTPAAAEQLAEVRPATDAALGQDLPTPTSTEWENVWGNVEAGVETDSGAGANMHVAPVSNRSIAKGARLWRPAAALAACVALMLVWRVTSKPADAGWEIKLSDHVVVHDLEIYDDGAGFIAFDDDGAAMIWVFEANGSQEGA